MPLVLLVLLLLEVIRVGTAPILNGQQNSPACCREAAAATALAATVDSNGNAEGRYRSIK